MQDSLPTILLICNREGQVLAGTAAPPDFSLGTSLLDHIRRRDAVCLHARGPDGILLPLCHAAPYRTLLLSPAAFGIPSLFLLHPLTARPAVLAALCRTGALSALTPSPALAAQRGAASPAACEAAYRELVQSRARIDRFTAPETAEDGFTRCADILRSLITLPPLRGCSVTLTLTPGSISAPMHFSPAIWSSILFCLCRFLYRESADAALSLTLIGTAPAPTVMLGAKLACPLPAGPCSPELLAEHRPKAPELALAQTLARLSGVALEGCVTPDGMLTISGQPHRLDPSLLGLKQENALTDAAEAATAEEWYRLLPAAVLTER